MKMKNRYGWTLPATLLFLSFTSLAGGYFDIWWHVRGKVETFFTIPHLVIYSSILMGGIITLVTVIFQLIKIGSFAPYRFPHVKALALIGTGKLLELLAGVMDGFYHEWVGFDVTLWSPPHLLVIFGGVVVALGIAELFLSMSKGKWMNIGFILSLGLAVSNFQFAMTEYDIRTGDYGLDNRWEPFAIYYGAMMIPILIYVFLLAQRRFGRSIAVWIMLIPFFYKLAVYLIWSVTPAQMYFPLVFFLAAFIYDKVYNALCLRSKYASYYGLIGLSIGLTAIMVWRSPIKITPVDIFFAFSYVVILGALTIYFSNRFLAKGDFHRV